MSDGKVAGVAVLLQAGSANPTIEKIWQHMPKSEARRRLPELRLIPRPAARCYRILHVHGLVDGSALHGERYLVCAKDPLDISAEQIDAFAKLYPHDVRPLQPLNGRVVKESQ